jgi:MYXO-CTERM domain-containing protein
LPPDTLDHGETMTFKPVAAALVALTAALPATATVLTLDFETPTSFASIDTHYAGGTDGAGVSGVNLGVSFGGDVLALQSTDGVDTYFTNAPSGTGAMTIVGSSAAMNVATGFLSISLAYSALDAVVGGVQVWSGVDGTGELLGSLDLTGNAVAGCSGSPFCNFDSASLGGFSQRAFSVTFSNSAFVALFDDVSLTVPAPASALLAALGLAALAATRRRG